MLSLSNLRATSNFTDTGSGPAEINVKVDVENRADLIGTFIHFKIYMPEGSKLIQPATGAVYSAGQNGTVEVSTVIDQPQVW